MTSFLNMVLNDDSIKLNEKISFIDSFIGQTTHHINSHTNTKSFNDRRFKAYLRLLKFSKNKLINTRN